jgi:hypothetical protein
VRKLTQDDVRLEPTDDLSRTIQANIDELAAERGRTYAMAVFCISHEGQRWGELDRTFSTCLPPEQLAELRKFIEDLFFMRVNAEARSLGVSVAALESDTLKFQEKLGWSINVQPEKGVH